MLTYNAKYHKLAKEDLHRSLSVSGPQKQIYILNFFKKENKSSFYVNKTSLPVPSKSASSPEF